MIIQFPPDKIPAGYNLCSINAALSNQQEFHLIYLTVIVPVIPG